MMKRGVEEIARRLEDGRVMTSHPVALFRTLADAVGSSMGGTSGILLEVLFRKMGTAS